MPKKRWNANRAVGERLRFTIAETQDIFTRLALEGKAFEACLFALGIDTMLRSSDLLALKVRDVQDEKGDIRRTIICKQQKTRFPVYPILTKQSRKACEAWIAESDKNSNEYLFSNKKTDKPISYGWYRELVKRWVNSIGLNGEHYSTHSLRRTKALYLYYVERVDIQHVSQLLGHKDIPSTSHYLRLQISAAQEAALAANIFEANLEADKNIKLAKHQLLEPDILKAIGNEVAKQVVARLRKMED